MSQMEDGKREVMEQAAVPDEPAPVVARPRPNVRLAGGNPRAWLILLAILVLGLTADLVSKHLAFTNIADQPVVLDRDVIVGNPDWHPPNHGPSVLIPKIMQFRLVLNRGAVFGIGPGQRWFFIVFTVLAVGIALSVFAFRTRSRQVVVHVALGCILAGALGNLYDRYTFGAVRDFLNMFPEVNLPFGWHWGNGSAEVFPWVYNVADVLLLCGIGLLMLRMLWAGKGAGVDEQADGEGGVESAASGGEG